MKKTSNNEVERGDLTPSRSYANDSSNQPGVRSGNPSPHGSGTM